MSVASIVSWNKMVTKTLEYSLFLSLIPSHGLFLPLPLVVDVVTQSIFINTKKTLLIHHQSIRYNRGSHICTRRVIPFVRFQRILSITELGTIVSFEIMEIPLFNEKIMRLPSICLPFEIRNT